MLLELYIVPQNYVLSEAVLSKVLIGVNLGFLLEQYPLIVLH